MTDLSNLLSGIDELQEAINRTSVRGQHFIPDLVSIGFARDVLENAIAVREIAGSAAPRAVYPSARAAFEAVFELIYLIGEGDYDLLACRARTVELYNFYRARDLADQVMNVTGQDRPAEVPLIEDVVEDEASGWDEIAPGQGAILRRAFVEITQERKNRQFNWYRTNRSQMQKKVAPMIGGGAETENMIASWYSLLSMQSHPAPRIDSVNLQWHEDGRFIFGIPADQQKSAIAPAVGAAYVATKAAARELAGLQTAGESGSVPRPPAA